MGDVYLELCLQMLMKRYKNVIFLRTHPFCCFGLEIEKILTKKFSDMRYFYYF
mgnify:CR=1 FL=1